MTAPEGYEQAIGADTAAVILRDVHTSGGLFGDNFGEHLAKLLGVTVIALFGDQTLDALNADEMRAAGWIRRADLVPHVVQAAEALMPSDDYERVAVADALRALMEVVGADPPGVDTMTGVPGRYALYLWAPYEAGGGNRDLVGTYRDVPAAIAAAAAEVEPRVAYRCGEIVDRWTMRVVQTWDHDSIAWLPERWDGMAMVPTDTV